LNKTDFCPFEVQSNSTQTIIQQPTRWQELQRNELLLLCQVLQQIPLAAAQLIFPAALCNANIMRGRLVLKIHLPCNKVPDEIVYYSSITRSKLQDVSVKAARNTYLPSAALNK